MYLHVMDRRVRQRFQQRLKVTACLQYVRVVLMTYHSQVRHRGKQVLTGKVQRDRVEMLILQRRHRSVATSFPLRRIATRVQSRSTQQVMRRHQYGSAAATRLADEREDGVLEDRIKPDRRLIEDDQVARCINASTSDSFCLLPVE